MHPSVPELWRLYREIAPAAPAEIPAAFYFCDNREDADICADLVVQGRKRATACSLAELELSGQPVPQAGDFAIVTDWDGRARAVIRTKAVEIRAFIEVNAEFAREEGEGDLSLEWWRTAHRAYFERVLAGSRHTADDALLIACERFEVVLRA